jgi:hypothetical protein
VQEYRDRDPWNDKDLRNRPIATPSKANLLLAGLWLGFGNLNSGYLQYASCMLPSVRRSRSPQTCGRSLRFRSHRAINTQFAEAIAKAAQAFGQEDDITVLSIVRSQQVNRT